jgi:hypothetical protein
MTQPSEMRCRGGERSFVRRQNIYQKWKTSPAPARKLC